MGAELRGGPEDDDVESANVCLVDYRLGARNGVDLLRAAFEGGCQSPIILLTGAGARNRR